jgi:chromosome partitioning protein
LNLQAYDLAHISDFNSLIAISQNLGRPVFALTDEDLKNAKQFGWALETMKESRTAFSDQFKILGELIISLTS